MIFFLLFLSWVIGSYLTRRAYLIQESRNYDLTLEDVAFATIMCWLPLFGIIMAFSCILAWANSGLNWDKIVIKKGSR